MKKITCQFLFIALVSTLMAACSRPVAYLQKSPRETVARAMSPTAVTQVAVTEAVTPGPAEVAAPATLSVPMAIDQVDALVRNDSKLAADKTVQKRLNRVRTLLATSDQVDKSASAHTARPASFTERMVIKKLDKQITKKFSPQKPTINSGTLATGAVLVIIGLLLMVLTSGTAATIGLVALVIGVIALLLGLL
ncbi:hypothetical protein [Spirosoma utsteinense]|uniref:Uncharacterized protein n=1 Tax=Spirosoma utsteinense TaxID=2585773 RepID=A0ABR6WA66_9BACT|nr:hypothetical protein [Spirosoma utsteinense]MBC3784065.1 hypothetical protein [Spirosoma utsteinense]MBC3793445.1 hypothetical protein [Spirosoma utsteinense]